ncbi:MAG: DJ-1/PfpI family protein [Deltaproteobacteria bacterium]|nr:MAG: DJ-1/PfpI family protein [Deltaproteobacteria bacterium]
MRAHFLVYDRFTALDAIGPYEVISRLPNVTLRVVSRRRGEVRADTGALALIADEAIDEVKETDLLLVPGGPGSRDLLADGHLLEWLREIDATTQWTTSVCTGSLVLAAAGLLEGRKATTHWTCLELLAGFGARPTSHRVVRDGKYVTAAGVSAGIDMALSLAQTIGGRDVAESIALGIEYDPEPPVNAGSPAKARPEIIEAVRRRIG